MQKELEAIKKNKKWSLTDLPLGHKLISLKWVFELKRNSDKNVIKHNTHGKGICAAIRSSLHLLLDSTMYG